MELTAEALNTPSALWKYQIDLLDLQINIHEEIRRVESGQSRRFSDQAKVLTHKPTGWKERLAKIAARRARDEIQVRKLKHTLMLSRELGDALAWALLRGNEGYMVPLSQNSRVGSTPTKQTRIGVVAIAQHLANSGAGFPILHDATDMLRVGDITFVGPDAEPITVEVKTHFKGRNVTEGTDRYSVEVWGTARKAQELIERTTNDLITNTTSESRRRNARFERQMKRMDKLEQLSHLKHGNVALIDGRRTTALSLTEAEPESHWKLARTLAEEARIRGFAFSKADSSMLIGAIFAAPPITFDEQPKDMPFLEEWRTELVNCGIFFPKPFTDRNHLMWSINCSQTEKRSSSYLLPFPLYPLGPDLVMEFLRGRLWFIVAINLGRIAEALESRGFRIELPISEKDYQENFIRIFSTKTAPDNVSIESELRNTYQYALKMLHNFSSLENFVWMVEQLDRAGWEAFLADQFGTQSD